MRGLIITYHGFANFPVDHRIIGRFLYDEGYDIVHAVLAGHYYSGDQWPSTTLSKEYGGGTVPQTVFKNPELRSLLESSRTDPSRIPVLINRLIQLEPNFERVMSAQTYMASLDRDEDANFARFFDSNHRDYATGAPSTCACAKHIQAPSTSWGYQWAALSRSQLQHYILSGSKGASPWRRSWRSGNSFPVRRGRS